jgi:hypothetical protein
MWVGCNPCRVSGLRPRNFAVLALAAALIAGCSSKRDERAEAEADGRTTSGQQSGDVLAAFEAWAHDGQSTGNANQDGATGTPGVQASTPQSAADNPLGGVIAQFNKKVSTCWKQPFGMPRLATVRLLVQFNPDGTVHRVEPRPEASEALRYRTEAPYLVMIAQTSQALRRCQPYEGIRQNFTELSQLEMVVDPRMFQN